MLAASSARATVAPCTRRLEMLEQDLLHRLVVLHDEDALAVEMHVEPVALSAEPPRCRRAGRSVNVAALAGRLSAVIWPPCSR